MKRLSLHFDSFSVETLYTNYRWNSNNFPCKMLLLFNILVQISQAFNSFLQKHYIAPLMGFSCQFLLLFFYKLYKRYPLRHYLQDWYIVFSILFPFMCGTYFGCLSLLEESRPGFEWYLGGFTFQMFFAYLFKFKMNWYQTVLAKFVGFFFLLGLDQKWKQRESLSDQLIVLMVITLSGSYLDFIQDKNERTLWEKELTSSQENECFKNILDEVPDQVVIFDSELKITYSNRATFSIFSTKDPEILRSKLMKKIEIIEFHSFEHHNQTEFASLGFSQKITEVLSKNRTENDGFVGFSAHLFLEDRTAFLPSKKLEFDVKMKKILLSKGFGVMMLLSKVDEKNLNSRLEYVNSFLNYVLGNVSHDIYTPLNVLLGMIDSSIERAKDQLVQTDLSIARKNGEILHNILSILRDIFSIRKGSLIMTLSSFDVCLELGSIHELFSQIFASRNITFKYNSSSRVFIKTDCARLRQVLICILNTCSQTLENGTIELRIETPSLIPELYEVNIDIEGKIFQEGSFGNSFQNRLLNKNADNELCENRFDLTMSFSLVNFLLLCLSGGTDDQISIQSFDNLEKNESKLALKFKLKDVMRMDSLTIADPFRIKETLNLRYCTSESNEASNNTMYEFSPVHRSPFTKQWCSSEKIQSPFSSSSAHQWPDKNDKSLNKSCDIIREVARQDKIQGLIQDSCRSMRLKCKELDSLEKGITLTRNTEDSCFLTKSEQRKKIILNVDDFVFNLMVISHFCRMNGVEVIEAKNGLEAVQEVMKLYEERGLIFDIIFMDCDMPLMNGFEASEKINEFFEGKLIERPAIIAITANVMNEDTDNRILRSGMKEIIVKPLGIKKFKEIMRKYSGLDLGE